MSSQIENPISICFAVFLFINICFFIITICSYIFSCKLTIFFPLIISNSALCYIVIQILYFRFTIGSINYILK